MFKLLLVVSVFGLFLFGMGNALRVGVSRWLGVALPAGYCLPAGLLVNCVLSVTGLPFRAVGFVGLLLGFAGALGALKTPFRATSGRGTLGFWLMAGAVLLPSFVLVFGEPIQAWDSRVNWFFQAKVMAQEGAVRPGVDWRAPIYSFAQWNYPKMMTALTGQLMSYLHVWNEYLPKMSLLFLLGGYVSLVGAAFKSRLLAGLVVAGASAASGELIWNGYMDGYVAMYSSVGVVLLLDHLRTRDVAALLGAGIAFGVAASLKAESLFFMVAVAAATAGVSLWGRKENVIPSAGARPWVVALLFAAGPLVIWELMKARWQIVSYFQVEGSLADLVRSRLTGSGRWKEVLYHVLRESRVWRLVVFAVAVQAVGWWRNRRLERLEWLPTFSAGIYLIMLCGIYLCTPWDLDWHLTSSSPRTVMQATVTLWTGICVLAAGCAGWEVFGSAAAQKLRERG